MTKQRFASRRFDGVPEAGSLFWPTFLETSKTDSTGAFRTPRFERCRSSRSLLDVLLVIRSTRTVETFQMA